MKDWPIIPRFISLRDTATEESANLNEDGIFYPDYIRGFLGDSSLDQNINNPLTLFQFVPQNFNAINFNGAIKIVDTSIIDPVAKEFLGDRKLIRIDTDNLCPNRDCCVCYREHGFDQESFCQRQDSRVALLANPELDSFDIDENFDEYFSKVQEIISSYNVQHINNEDYYIKAESYNYQGEYRIYLSYICTESYLQEYLFPVYACGKIIACIIQGQIVHKHLYKSRMFRNTLKEQKIPNLKKTINKIKIPKDYNWEEEIQKRINAIYKRIKLLEQRINERINIRTLNYISKSFAEIKDSFSHAFEKLSISDEELFDKFHQILDDTLENICCKFNNRDGFIRLFAIPIQEYSDKFKLIGSSGNISHNEQNKYYFSISDEERLEITKFSNEYSFILDKDSTQLLLNNASTQIRAEFRENDILRVVSTISPKVYFIIWKRYVKWESKHGYELYKDAIFSLYNLIFQSYSFARGALSETMLENSIRISNHEAAQIVPAIAGAIQVDFIQKSAIALTEDIRNGVFYKRMNNFYNQLYLLDGIYQRPSYIFKEMRIEPQWVDLFDALKKLYSLFLLQARDKKIRIICEHNNIENVNIYVERKLFDHILYNLIENAVKYGYEGSNINILARYTKKDFRIQVISYGPHIDKKDRIYDLFVRGTSNTVKSVEGMGIGMFVSKKLCRIHEGELEHTSDVIFPSHLPAIYFYRKAGKDTEGLASDLENLMHKLDDLQNISEYVNVEANLRVGKHKIESVSNMSTSRNCFSIIFPFKNVQARSNK